MLARRFLYVIAILIVLALGFGVAWTLMQDRLLRLALVPRVAFQALPDRTAPDYARSEAWLARPDLTDDPSHWLPAGFPANGKAQAAVFYIAPTTYLNRDHWNAPLDDADANGRLTLFAQSQASAFNGIGEVWAPRYRQATFGAFLATSDPRSGQAIDFAYRDIARAFDVFLAAVPPTEPIILAAHSQGSLHLLRLLREKVAGRLITKRIVAAYVVGWPISVTADLPALGLPACRTADQEGCILSWQSFADPADPRLVTTYFDQSRGYAGQPRKGTQMLCVNPLTGNAGDAAPPSANLGALVPKEGLAGADLVKGLVPAQCTPEGLLLIGGGPAGFGDYVLPGNNYHVFDYALFWANIRKDAGRRLKAFQAL